MGSGGGRILISSPSLLWILWSEGEKNYYTGKPNLKLGSSNEQSCKYIYIHAIIMGGSPAPSPAPLSLSIFLPSSLPF